MRRQVLADEEVEALVNDAFVAVAIDVKDPDAADPVLEQYPIGAWPSTYVTDSNGGVLGYAAGRLSKAEFLELLDTASAAR